MEPDSAVTASAGFVVSGEDEHHAERPSVSRPRPRLAFRAVLQRLEEAERNIDAIDDAIIGAPRVAEAQGKPRSADERPTILAVLSHLEGVAERLDNNTRRLHEVVG